ncbi:MAG: enoyl-CoA hydratase/isomerase family protein [Oscillospiraceae bacterium]|nr:enoyl-CoA hydratase/isomerase family protein [Oscillospiraceae bacterium]MDD7294047.1 enoyl-CoA hydratase/isomerase family protein [Oscillospiraceae bacterium]MDY2509763.1 enoyl-CoA hydratase/isomerase family protein [Ruminococcus callidus]
MEQTKPWFEQTEENGVLVLTMQAPGNNLMTGAFLEAYEKTMEQISQRTDLKGLVIRGTARHFSVGADVASLAERSAADLESMTSDTDLPPEHIRQKKAFTFLHDLPFPVVSVISGFCIGSGSEIAVNSHIRICEPTARIGQPESTFGILPGLGGIARNVEICGLSMAAEMVLTGKLFSAQQAFEMGWADLLAEKKGGLAEALALIAWIVENVEQYNRKKTGFYVAQYLQSKGVSAG